MEVVCSAEVDYQEALHTRACHQKFPEMKGVNGMKKKKNSLQICRQNRLAGRDLRGLNLDTLWQDTAHSVVADDVIETMCKEQRL